MQHFVDHPPILKYFRNFVTPDQKNDALHLETVFGKVPPLSTKNKKDLKLIINREAGKAYGKTLQYVNNGGKQCIATCKNCDEFKITFLARHGTFVYVPDKSNLIHMNSATVDTDLMKTHCMSTVHVPTTVRYV